MTEERRARRWALFEEAADLPPPEQQKVLDAACAGDPDLRAEVEKMLADDARLRTEEGESFLQSPVLRPAPLAPAPTFAMPLPQQIGPYRILRLLGQGGMGAVYEAEQDNPRRLIALKVIRPGLVEPSLLRRFTHEAQLLGRLHHPGIAQIHEAGVAADGQPFFALELIRGVALNEYVTRHNLDPAGRLELLAQVCDAVQHAHDQGIIHRDLKPSNILVDESGRPKVLDFGVGRATDAGLLTSTDHTRTGQLLGTLGYMSPEQVTSAPHELDGRSDVYTLGVVLFELLVGRLPFHVDHLPLPEAARTILEHEPSRLGSLDTRFRGDIETIVAKALEKDKTRRYQSAAELAADIRRHLRNEPIRARPPSALYQLRKFARRQKALVGGVLGVMAALAIGTVVSVIFAVRANQNAQEAGENARQSQEHERSARYQTYRARLAAAAAALSHHDVADAARQLDEAPDELRGWEWRHLQARLDDSAAVLPAGQPLRQGPSGFRFAAFTPDALLLSDEDGRQISSNPRPGNPGWRPVIHFAGDATWLVADISDRSGGVVRLRESTGRERLLRLPPGHHGADTLQFSPNGLRLAVLQSDHSVSICDVSECRQTAHCARAGSKFNAMAFSEDGRRLAMAADDGRGPSVSVDWPTVSVWDADTGRIVAELHTSMTRVLGIAFHPRGDRLATALSSGTVRQWDLRTGTAVERPYERHEGEVCAVAYSPDGLRIASAGQDRTVRLWRAEGQQDEAVLHGHTRRIIGLMFNRDGRRLSSWEEAAAVRLWDTGPDATLPVLRGHTSYVYPVAYTPDGRRIASGSWDGTVRLWDAATGSKVAVLPQGGVVRMLALSPDGTRLAAMGDETASLRIWDVASGRKIATFQTNEKSLAAAAYRPDGAQIAVLAPGQFIEILDATTGKQVAVIDSGNPKLWGPRRPLAYSPDGRLLAGPFEENQVGLWETETYRLVGKLAGHQKAVMSVSFSTDGRRLVSAGADSLIRVWDVESKECRLILRGHADEVFDAKFHPDGSRIASGGRDGLVRIWDTATGEEFVRLPGHANYIFSLAFSPDGNTLASGSGDYTVRLWDTAPLRVRYQARREAEAAP